MGLTPQLSFGNPNPYPNEWIYRAGVMQSTDPEKSYKKMYYRYVLAATLATHNTIKTALSISTSRTAPVHSTVEDCRINSIAFRTALIFRGSSRKQDLI